MTQPPHHEIAQLDTLRAMLEASSHTTAFTGAGISTESGIPDFRGPQGLWKTVRPTQFQDFIGSDTLRQETWRRRFDGDRAIERALPNKGHLAVAQLVREGLVASVITQNVDNLHQDSGVPPSQVIELHGNATYATCLSCATRYELADLEHEMRLSGGIGPCRRCGGIIKSATISFGQAMPEDAMARALTETLASRLFIVMGSSLVVYPAAAFPEQAKRRGARLVIVNNEATPLDGIADLIVRQPLGAALSYVAGIN